MKTTVLVFAAIWLASCSRYPANDFECRVKVSESPTVVGARELIDACEVKFEGEIVSRARKAAPTTFSFEEAADTKK